MNDNFFSYVSLKTIVALFMDTHDKSYGGNADKCWILAWRALVDIFHNISAEPKTVRIPLNGNDTATLPSDYAGWMKIGVLNSDNTISTLRINENITLWKDLTSQYPNDLQPNVQSPITNNSAFFPFYLNYYYNDYCYVLNECVPEGINYAGECRVDEANKIIVFDKKYQYPDVMLEYKAVPSMDGDYKVETFWQEPIIAFIEWKLKLGTQQDYYNRCIEARRKMPKKKVTLQVIEQMARYGNAYKIRI